MKMKIRPPTDGAKLPPLAGTLRRLSVAAILRAAYRRFASDAATRRAVRRCLP